MGPKRKKKVEDRERSVFAAQPLLVSGLLLHFTADSKLKEDFAHAQVSQRDQKESTTCRQKGAHYTLWSPYHQSTAITKCQLIVSGSWFCSEKCIKKKGKDNWTEVATEDYQNTDFIIKLLVAQRWHFAGGCNSQSEMNWALCELHNRPVCTGQQPHKLFNRIYRTRPTQFRSQYHVGQNDSWHKGAAPFISR